LDPSQQTDSMFEQAGQTVINNKMFGAGNPESDALARIIAGSLNIFGDPTTYLGIGAIKAGIKAGARAGARGGAQLDLVESFTPDAARELISKSDFMIKQSEFIVTARQAMDKYPNGADWYTALSKDPNWSSYVAENGQWIANIPAMIGSKTVPDLLAESQALRVRVGQAKDYINSPAARAADIKTQMDADFAERTKDMFVAGPDGIEPKTWFPWQRPKTPDQQLLSVFRNRIRPGQLALPPGTGKPNSRTLFRPGNDPHKPLSELWDRRMMAELVEYVFRPKTVHNFTMHQTRQSVDKAFTMDGGYKIPKGSQIARIASGSDSEALAAMKPGQSVVLDRFLSVTDATAPLELRAYKFLKGMAEGSVKTGGTDRAPGKLGAYIKFNVKTDVPGIMDINKILPNVNKFLGRPFDKPSNVVDGLLARGQSMKLRKVRRDKKTGQIIYHVDLGQGIRATKGFISGTRNFEKEMPKFYAKGGMVKSYAKGGLATNKFAMGGLVSPKYFAMGGLVSPKYFADGGMAQGTDTVPAMLTPGEFVVNKKATDMYGPLLAAMNSSPAANLSMMGSKTFSEPVYNMPSRGYSDVGGNVGIYSSSNNSPSLTALDNSVYNYSLSVNVEGTNASANDIANVVMNKIKTIDSQQLRRQVLR
jgi:hypothetical protein